MQWEWRDRRRRSGCGSNRHSTDSTVYCTSSKQRKAERIERETQDTVLSVPSGRNEEREVCICYITRKDGRKIKTVE